MTAGRGPRVCLIVVFLVLIGVVAPSQIVLELRQGETPADRGPRSARRQRGRISGVWKATWRPSAAWRKRSGPGCSTLASSSSRIQGTRLCWVAPAGSSTARPSSISSSRVRCRHHRYPGRHLHRHYLLPRRSGQTGHQASGDARPQQVEYLSANAGRQRGRMFEPREPDDADGPDRTEASRRGGHRSVRHLREQRGGRRSSPER